MTAPEFLVIGHAVQDLAPDRPGQGPPWCLGGTVSFAALQARRLDLHTAVLTATAPDLPLDEALPGVEIVCVPSPISTHFRNVYTAEGRIQYAPQRAPDIGPDALPQDWRDAGIVLLGGVIGEVDAALATCFPAALIGASAQGWLRRTDADGRVQPLAPESWQAEPVLRNSHVLFVSDEDLPPSRARAVVEGWSRQVDVLAFTHGDRGAEVCHRGDWRRIDAFPAAATDPTGAGDVFATAFLVRYREGGDPWEAARFGACAASFIVESDGLAGTADREMIETRLKAHPEIVAR